MLAVNKGLLAELRLSNYYHRMATPVLVSSLVVRERGMGQVDLAIMSKTTPERELKVIEVKSSRTCSQLQLKRLRKAAHFLGLILECPAYLEVAIPSNCDAI